MRWIHTLLKHASVHLKICWGQRGRWLVGEAARRQKLADHPLHLGSKDVVDFGVHYLGHNPVDPLLQHARSANKSQSVVSMRGFLKSAGL